MRILKYLFIIAIFTITSISCTDNTEEQIKTQTEIRNTNGDGDLDDPVDPDRDDN